ncbi:MAG: sulfatase-like hydrolase/transferase [Legionella sp.]
MLAAKITAISVHNEAPIWSKEPLESYLLVIALGIIPGFAMIFLGTFIRILLATLLVTLLILVQIHNTDFIKTLYTLPSTSWIIVLCFVLVAILFYLIRERLDVFLLIIFGVVWVGAFFTDVQPFISVQTFPITSKKNTQLPPYIHIILDEHIGIEGISPRDDKHLELATNLRTQYIQRGFKIYGRAYSRDLLTQDSFPDFLNFKAVESLNDYVDAIGDTVIIKKNALFAALSQKGYHLTVFQSSYLDMCNNYESFHLKKCITYRITGVEYERTVSSDTLISSKKQSIYLLDFHNSPQATYRAFGEVLKLAQEVEMGEAYFIHLLLPHRQFVFDKNCSVIRKYGSNPQSYYGQVQCTQKLMDKLLQTLAKNPATKNSTLIIHSDHGSRVLIPEPKKNKFLPINFVQLFSSFFVVRSPLIKPGYDRTMLPLDVLLKTIVLGDSLTTVGADQKPFVFIRNDNQKNLGTFPMPEFSHGMV